MILNNTPNIELLHGDCLELMPAIPDKSIDMILTDPPYPDYHAERYGYYDGIIDFLKDYPCRQLIFWSAKVPFPLDYTACHVWDKKCGVGSMYEFIYERNGGNAYKVFNYYLINSTVAASYTGDKFFDHPSQKPIKLINKLINEFSEAGQLILDPFAGSGTTAIACYNTNRNAILMEKDDKYFKVASKRIADHVKQIQIQFSDVNKINIQND